MKIEKSREGSTLNLTIDDRLDTKSAPELEAVFNAELSGIDNICIDFSKVEYVSSAGLRALLNGYRMLEGRGCVTVRNANEIVKEVFEVTGMNSVLNVE